jgi:hypothetical protein
MLFYNIDHIERALRPQSKAASSGFFMGSASMCRFFAHIESEEPLKAADSAAEAAGIFEASANDFRALSQLISSDFAWVKDAVREVSFADAARELELSPESPVLRDITIQLVRGELDIVLQSCADTLAGFARDLRNAENRLLGINILQDLEYANAQALISRWRTTIVRGQFVSAVCLISMTVSS